MENARIKALEQAKGEYIWFVDSDDIIAPGGVAAIVSALQKDFPDYQQAAAVC